MADYVLIDGDKAVFTPAFAPATVIVQSGTLRASGPATVSGKSMCIAGDESSVSVPGCTYTTPQYSIPGVGTLEIERLNADQQATKTRSGDAKALLVGSRFVAKFNVTTPAMQPPPGPGSPTPDSSRSYSGSGSFITTNHKFRGV